MDKIKHLADVQRLIRILIYLLIWFIHHEHIKKIKKEKFRLYLPSEIEVTSLKCNVK